MLKRMLSYGTLPLLLLLSSSSGNSASEVTRNTPEVFNPGPDAIAGDMADLAVFGTNGTQNGVAIGLTTCNGGNQFINYFAIPDTRHPAVAPNLYRMSGGTNNNDRFEQIGQSWVKHTFGAKQANSCSFGCQPGGDFTHLGVGCSDTYFASQSADQGELGSRAWINPFTGIFPSNARDHTGHVHTAVSHMMLIESNDLNQTLNPGATYYAELLYLTPDEYAWCQAHAGECNMYNNSSYRQYSVSGTTSFSFSPIGSTVRMTPAINAWPGATIQTIEPEPGVDGRAFLAYKVTGPVAGLYHYEYAIYNQNLDRGIQSFSVPLPTPLPFSIEPTKSGGAENLARRSQSFNGPTGALNHGFHAPPQHPGFAADGTQGDAGFSSAEWTFGGNGASLTWNSETFAQNPNANAIRWGTLYNFRFDSTSRPVAANATIGFFKTGTPITVATQGPAPDGLLPTPTPTPVHTPTPAPTPTATPITPTPTPTPTSSPNPTPTPTSTPTPIGITHPLELSTRCLVCRPQYGCFGLVSIGDGVGIGGFIITGTASPPSGSGPSGGPRQVLLRGIGPSLLPILGDALEDPALELHGPGGFQTITNDNWMDTQQAEILATGLAPTNALESAIYAVLDPGSYTVILKNNGSGIFSRVGLVEIYDLTQTQGVSSRLGNISTRAFVDDGGGVMIAGFILGGSTGEDNAVIVRGIGPSLAQTGLTPLLPDPTLELLNTNGTVIDANNNWQDNAAEAAIITAAGLALPNPLESGLAATLAPGAYTVILDQNRSTFRPGFGLVEIYDSLIIGPTPSPAPGP